MTSVLILGPEEPHPTKKTRVGKLHLRDNTVLVEKDAAVAEPSNQVPQIFPSITAVVTQSVGCNVWATTKMLLPSSYCKKRKVPRC